jgi:hypothetical protein
VVSNIFIIDNQSSSGYGNLNRFNPDFHKATIMRLNINMKSRLIKDLEIYCDLIKLPAKGKNAFVIYYREIQ